MSKPCHRPLHRPSFGTVRACCGLTWTLLPRSVFILSILSNTSETSITQRATNSSTCYDNDDDCPDRRFPCSRRHGAWGQRVRFISDQSGFELVSFDTSGRMHSGFGASFCTVILRCTTDRFPVLEALRMSSVRESELWYRYSALIP